MDDCTCHAVKICDLHEHEVMEALLMCYKGLNESALSKLIVLQVDMPNEFRAVINEFGTSPIDVNKQENVNDKLTGRHI